MVVGASRVVTGNFTPKLISTAAVAKCRYGVILETRLIAIAGLPYEQVVFARPKTDTIWSSKHKTEDGWWVSRTSPWCAEPHAFLAPSLSLLASSGGCQVGTPFSAS